jgi:hypothetical protein
MYSTRSRRSAIGRGAGGRVRRSLLEGILTGKEALEVDGRLEDEVRSIEIDISQGVGELPGVAEFGATPDEAENIAKTILEEGQGQRPSGRRQAKKLWNPRRPRKMDYVRSLAV